MKTKLFLGAILVAFATLSTSCVKQRNCQCTTTLADGTTSTSNMTLSSVSGVNGSKKKAAATCDGYDSSDSYSTVECELTK